MKETITKQLIAVQQASREIITLTDETINSLLCALADSIPSHQEAILQANQKDIERMDPADPMVDRLLLNASRLDAIAADIRNVASLPSPLDALLEERVLPNGLNLKKVTVPIGVIGIIYEARPNVTFDVFALCLKSGNATVLKGGSDAMYSNIAIVELIHSVLKQHGINPDTLYLLPAEREAAAVMLNAVGYIDMIIPRGSQKLIDFVRNNAKVPVIETGAGIVHTYFDKSGDLDLGKHIIFNAKTRRPSVCNALDTLVIHQERLADLPALVEPLQEKQVMLFADEAAFQALQGSYPDDLLHQAEPEHFGTEFLSLKMSVKTVSSLEEALEHITRYSSRHSEAIIATDPETTATFLKRVDAAVVYANTSTAFTDGAQFGLGAEIGISTQKLHARGPMALKELTTYKWIIEGNGQTRPA
ncbi:glutamate-5-semialdehyde dehydrogenase [Pelodictyon phaeoclathratiforme]|jgi:glutamate-5-semialdehyde dehydrogenase|uniref:Gamma-glutamyl phosphate reductase n=1 Tax=Pelodictyon phaeoclathratiforme (strain DSM 5477 / BU-1) TaxID=324925 RepID=PROA_PELPB|nr:glutamate-5-semialdehyde dehydrogenase [Pelodictyon phaeoclathratiforme]B4SG68.1 RecName: Full=Gamma-glutamyl phosphate reductase; Short=GPR; AltName: Full=Glutamate-5-semialdehyde dehydrogenase; AltName: Full=Glutamyl-gamma-semialdehyde dehydrogenase; Short=GSA dehydrogenase [Pelodictyon phaeoclathratiforme BU-1]ACF43379.1 gamma-glutamyl phosphate reductase [Pelodictyon phaeoclathratiforme BU-1]MBV5289321.1 glutamate-5-semialdehyde dehydrogenase [Pelodictyon phaeoclathratiforme]